MFVVRVMEPAGDDALRGVVRRVADGSEHPFRDSDQLIALLGHQGGPAGADELRS